MQNVPIQTIPILTGIPAQPGAARAANPSMDGAFPAALAELLSALPSGSMAQPAGTPVPPFGTPAKADDSPETPGGKDPAAQTVPGDPANLLSAAMFFTPPPLTPRPDPAQTAYGTPERSLPPAQSAVDGIPVFTGRTPLFTRTSNATQGGIPMAPGAETSRPAAVPLTPNAFAAQLPVDGQIPGSAQSPIDAQTPAEIRQTFGTVTSVSTKIPETRVLIRSFSPAPAAGATTPPIQTDRAQTKLPAAPAAQSDGPITPKTASGQTDFSPHALPAQPQDGTAPEPVFFRPADPQPQKVAQRSDTRAGAQVPAAAPAQAPDPAAPKTGGGAADTGGSRSREKDSGPVPAQTTPTGGVTGQTPLRSFADSMPAPEKPDLPDLARQLGNACLAAQQEGKSEIRVHLSPQELGGINIHIVSQGGTLTLQITADSGSTGHMLAANLPELSRSMADSGVNMHHVEVFSAATGGFGGEAGSFTGSGQQRHTARPHTAWNPAAAGGETERSQAAHDGAISILA